MADDKNDIEDAIEEAVETASDKTEDIKTKLLNPTHWIRALIMVVMFLALKWIVMFIVAIAGIVQWVLTLIMGEPNAQLRDFTASLNQYGYQIMQFVTLNSDERPFPFSDWPSGK